MVKAFLQQQRVSGSQLGPGAHCYFSSCGRKRIGTNMAKGSMDFNSCAEHHEMFFFKQVYVNYGGSYRRPHFHLNVVSTDSFECHLFLPIIVSAFLCGARLFHPSLCVYITWLIPADTFC